MVGVNHATLNFPALKVGLSTTTMQQTLFVELYAPLVI